jgi:urea transport system substrate-binding protein
MTDTTSKPSGIGKQPVSRRSLLKTGGALAVAGTGIFGFPAILRAQDKLKIGFHSALTGLETILGETQLNCFKLAVDEINAAGGAGGRMIEYLVEDNQTTTRGAIDKTRKFIEVDKVDVIIPRQEAGDLSDLLRRR